MAANPVAPVPDLLLETDKTDQQCTFRFSGKVTSSTTPLWQADVRKVIPERKTIVLDLSKVSHMDSAGLGALVGVWVSARRGNCELKLVGLSDRVRELLRQTALDKLFAISRFPETPSF